MNNAQQLPELFATDSLISDDEREIRDTVRAFGSSRLRPHMAEWFEAGQLPVRELATELGELGVLGMHLDGYGCAGMSATTYGLVCTELEAVDSGLRSFVSVQGSLSMFAIHAFGSDEQKQRWLPEMSAGRALGCFGLTEPDFGSNPAGMRTNAKRDGDDWVLNGTKMFITNGVHAELHFVGAKTDPDAKGSRGITIFAVEKGTPGFSVGRALKKTGWLSSDTAELILEDVRVPAENVLGEVNRGFYAVMKNFQNERIVLGALAAAEAQKALDLTVDYVKQRKAFGGVLWDKQVIRQRLADCQTRIEAGRQLVYHAARLDAAGMDCVREVSMVKAYCGELVNSVLYDCVQFHGGMGYMRETAVERMSRDARVQAIGGGASEVMLEEVAKRM